MRFAQLVIGPAGSGKSTYCNAVVQHMACRRTQAEVINLDPAAEYFAYDPLVDIRELIHVDDAMEAVGFGPNGGLLYCMDYLMENSDWLKEKLGDNADDYLLFDCPGQIELYTHMTTFKRLIDLLKDWDFQVCAVFLIDAEFLVSVPKFISATMSGLSIMVNLSIPHINVLSKMDLLSKSARRKIDEYLEPDADYLLGEMDDYSNWNKKYKKLSKSIANLIDDYNLVKFIPLNITDEESIADVLLTIDRVLQTEEDSDVRDRDFDPPETEDDNYE